MPVTQWVWLPCGAILDRLTSAYGAMAVANLKFVEKGTLGGANRPGSVDMPKDPVFRPKTVNGGKVPRNSDAECKIVEEFAAKLIPPPGQRGILTTMVAKEACGSCSSVYTEFNKRYPDVWFRIGVG